MEVRWTEWSEQHIARHGVSPAEVEEVVYDDNEHLWSLEAVLVDPIKLTTRVIGFTAAGRCLTVYLSPDPDPAGTAFVVTARPSTSSERAARGPRRT